MIPSRRRRDEAAAHRKAWDTRGRRQAGGGSSVTQQRGDYLRDDDSGRSARSLLEAVRAKGGFTYGVVSHRSPRDGFVLSLHPERSESHDVATLTPVKLREYMKRNRDLLKQKGNFFGAWKDGDKVYLDVSTVTKDRNEATRLALAHDQIAFYDLGKGESVDVNRAATSGGAAP